jgi:hypothetical protein
MIIILTYGEMTGHNCEWLHISYGLRLKLLANAHVYQSARNQPCKMGFQGFVRTSADEEVSHIKRFNGQKNSIIQPSNKRVDRKVNLGTLRTCLIRASSIDSYKYIHKVQECQGRCMKKCICTGRFSAIHHDSVEPLKYPTISHQLAAPGKT